MRKKIIEVLENTELKLLRKTAELQKKHIKDLQTKNKKLEMMLTKLLKKQNRKKTEIFTALTTGELPEDL